MPPLSYRQALDYILGLASDVEQGAVVPYTERVFKLERPRRLLELMRVDPHQVPSVHIAGTKGKGSTAAMIASVLRAAGYRVGLFTSPHLRTYRERLSIDGRPIGEEDLAGLVAAARPAVEQVHDEREWGQVSPFELTTALAFQWFARERVDVQVLETGLGGRLDATNIVTPLVAAITSISLDHTHILGGTLAAIAREKAGIIKPGVPVAVAAQPAAAAAVIRQRARELGSPLILVGRDVRIERGHAPAPVVAGATLPDRGAPAQPVTIAGRHGRYAIELPLLGQHQVENAATAIAALECLPERGLALGPVAIVEGLNRVRWPGRLQVLRTDPLVVADAAHNVDSAVRLAEAIRSHFRFDRLRLVFAASADKDLAGMGAVLGPIAETVVLSRTRHSRAASFELLRAAFGPHTRDLLTEPDVTSAIDRAIALAGPQDLVCVAGSVFTAAEALHWAEQEAVPLTVV